MEAKDCNNGIKCYKIRDEDEGSKYPAVNPILPQPPFLLLGVGSVRSSKTSTLINMLRRDDMYGSKYWDDTVIISNTINNDRKGKYLRDAFRVEDHFENRFIDDIISKQKVLDREDMPTQLIVLDDIISADFKKSTNNSVNSVSTRFRHYELSLMIFVQSFKAVSNMIRSNATDILIFRQQSTTELEKIQEEYADLAPRNFMNYYKIAHAEPYHFLYIDAQHNPAKFYNSFEELIGIGDKMVYTGSIPQDEEELFEKQKQEKKGTVK